MDTIHYTVDNKSVSIINQENSHAQVVISSRLEYTAEISYAIRKLIDAHAIQYNIFSFRFDASTEAEKLIKIYESIIEYYTAFVFIDDEEDDEETMVYTIFMEQ